MTVEEMHRRMSNKEFVGWQVYHGRTAQRQEMQELMAKHKK